MKKSIFTAAILFAVTLPFFAQKKADIIFMHDVHSFLQPAARGKTLINARLEKNPDTIIVDGGDFSMGTLYQTIYETDAPELRTLGELGVIGTTIGNHEFDYGIDGLVNMFHSAMNSGDVLPEFLLCNVDWSKDNDYTRKFKAVMDEYGAKDYVMIDKGGLKVALIGCFGKDAFNCSPTCELTFRDINEAVKETVQKIKKNENADLIICLSHSGTNPDPKLSEDELLAKAVPELDVIISAHTHTKLEEPIVVGDTYIVSCEAYFAYLGNLSLEQKENGRWTKTDYHLDTINDSIPEEENLKKKLEVFDRRIDEEYLAKYNLRSTDVIADSPYDYDVNHQTGYLMADSIAATLKKMGVESDFVVVPSGVIRGTYNKGPVTVSKVFETFSLGIGKDRLTGYPLVKFWIRGEEFESVCELDASLSPFMDYVHLYTSGLAYEYNKSNFIMDKTVRTFLVRSDGSFEPLERDRLYSVTVDMYTGLMLGNILKTTKGLITIVPRTADGEPISDFNDVIIYRKNGSELKGWIAIAESLNECMKDYSGREALYKQGISSFAPSKRFNHPSKVGIILSAVILVLILLAVLIVLLVVRKIKNKKCNGK